MELEWEDDVEIPGALDKWREAAKKAQIGASVGNLEKKDADRLAQCLRGQNKGARTVLDPKNEGKYRVWCTEKVKRTSRKKPAAGNPKPTTASTKPSAKGSGK